MSSFADLIRKQDNAIRDEMFIALTNVGKELRGKQQSVVSRWKRKPRFAMALERSRTYMSVTVLPEGEHKKIWGYVEEGTRAHFIRPKKPGGFLHFRTAYSARTAAVARYNVGTGKSSGKWVKARLVLHPGTKARKFGITFLAGLHPSLRVRISNAIRAGVARVK